MAWDRNVPKSAMYRPTTRQRRQARTQALNRNLPKSLRKYVRRNYKAKTSGGLTTRGPFPRQMYIKHPYSEAFILTTNSITPYYTGAELDYRMNSIFDPQFATGGQCPLGRNEMIAIYNKYKVSGLGIDITFTDPSHDGITAYVMVSNSTEVVALSNRSNSDLIERPNVWRRNINNTGSQVARVKFYCSLKQIEGLSKIQWDADTDKYCSVSDDNPAKTPFIRIAISGSAGDMTCKCQVKFTYYTKWYEQKTIARST